MSISSEKLRKVLHPIQIDTMHFRFKPRRNPGSQSQHRSVNRTAVVTDMNTLQDAGIGAIAIMPNDTETYPADSFDNMKEFAAHHGFTFPYVIDRTQDVARSYDAVCTPDFFGFTADLELQYRGRLDEGGHNPAPENARRELVEAMLQIAGTGIGPQDQIASMGCSIKWR